MSPSPEQVVRLLRQRPIVLVPADDPVTAAVLREPSPEPRSTEATTAATRKRRRRPIGPCGHCSAGVVSHGVQYGALVGWHTWAPERPSEPKDWREIRASSGRAS